MRSNPTPCPPACPADLSTSPTVSVPPLLLDLDQAAVALCLSPRSLKRLTAEGVVPGVVHLGRRRLYSRAILERWAADGCPHTHTGPRLAGKARKGVRP